MASELGLPIGTVVSRLASAFNVAEEVVAQWWSGVDSDFGVWVGQIESYLGLPLDFACYVEIDNTGGASDLVLQSANASEGSFVVGPPTWIPQGMVARLVLRDPKPSIHGSDGTIRYGYSNADLTMQAVTLHFECLTGILRTRPRHHRLPGSLGRSRPIPRAPGAPGYRPEDTPCSWAT